MNQRLVRIFFFLVSIPFLPRNLQNLVEAKQSVTNRLHPFNSSFCGMLFVPLYWLMMRVELKGMKKGGDFITNNGRSEMSRHVPFWKNKFTDPVLAQFLRFSSIFTDFPQEHLISRTVILISWINAGITMRCYLCLNKIIWNILVKWNSDI